MKIEDLPNDIHKLKKLFVESIKSKDNEIKSKETEISDLKDTILLLQRKTFGPSSEQSKDQLMLFDELEDIIEAEESSDEKETITYERKRGKRKPFPESLPRVDVIIDLPEEEKEGMKCIGEEVSEKLEITPAKVFVRRTIRKKYAPIDGDQKTIKIAPVPLELLPKSMASASLVAYIVTAKYCDALPLYRQEKIFERISAEIARQSMARWLIKVSEQLIPLYNLLQEKLLSSSYIQMDETTVQVLKEDGKKATSKSYMWVRHAPGESPILLFDYAPTRSGSVPIDLLESFSGYLQADGYDGYARACREYGLSRIGCWDHARRKFFEASKTSNGKGVGKKGIDKIKKLYKIEEKIRHVSPEERKKVREEKSVPILLEFKSWIDKLRSQITPDSRAGKAINYAFNEWSYLVRYVEDGRLNISNAWVENAIRPFCIGRKNWLFSTSVDGAKASAMYYSLIETAKMNGLDPFDYLNKMLDKLPHAQTVDDFERLLPLKGQFLAK
jgi:transposase